MEAQELYLATVEQLSPMQVRFDGTTTLLTVNFQPEDVTTVVVGDRVVVAVIDRLVTLISKLQSVGGGDAEVYEFASTPVGILEALRWSTAHTKMMRWNGTQWIFAEGPPANRAATSLGGLPSGTTWFAVTPTVGHLFPVEFRNVNAVANSGGRQYHGFSMAPMVGLRFRLQFRLPTSIPTRTVRAGWHDSADHNDAVDGMYFEIIDLTASFKTSQGSTRTTHGTTGLLTAGVWYVMHVIQTSSTTARGIIVSEAGTFIMDVTIPTNVPSVTQLIAGSMNVTRSDAVAASSMLELNDGFLWTYYP